MGDIEARSGCGGTGFGSQAWVLFLVLILLFFGIDGFFGIGFI